MDIVDVVDGDPLVGSTSVSKMVLVKYVDEMCEDGGRS